MEEEEEEEEEEDEEEETDMSGVEADVGEALENDGSVSPPGNVRCRPTKFLCEFRTTRPIETTISRPGASMFCMLPN